MLTGDNGFWRICCYSSRHAHGGGTQNNTRRDEEERRLHLQRHRSPSSKLHELLLNVVHYTEFCVPSESHMAEREKRQAYNPTRCGIR